jgi:hypothetical protein
MSRQALEAVIGRAVTDGAFRDALFARPDATLAEYDLTGAEIASLKALDFETLDSFAGMLDERVSRFSACRAHARPLLHIAEPGQSDRVTSPTSASTPCR